MPHSILVVGNCSPDNAALAQMVHENFDVEIETASSNREADRVLSERRFDLVLVNRIFDATGESGIEMIERVTSASVDSPPILIMTNFADQRQLAIEKGAEGGFGKSELNSPSTVETLRRFLAN